MPPDPQKSVYNLYAALNATIPSAGDSGQGGRLLYAGELSNSHLLYAANIAGAASIAASADPALQRQAIRDSTIDFLVTSLEEALRILKNEIRKHQAVSVGVAIAPSQLVEQMLDRGVLPELLPEASAMSPAQESIFQNQGSRKIVKADPAILQSGMKLVTWSLHSESARDFARILPKIDALAQSAIPENDVVRQRWLRLAPRYLGRSAQRHHSVAFTEEEFHHFKAQAGESPISAGAESAVPLRVLIEKWDL